MSKRNFYIEQEKAKRLLTGDLARESIELAEDAFMKNPEAFDEAMEEENQVFENESEESTWYNCEIVSGMFDGVSGRAKRVYYDKELNWDFTDGNINVGIIVSDGFVVVKS